MVGLRLPHVGTSRYPRPDMRFMLDTMIFTHIVSDAAFAKVVRDAARTGSITLVTTHIQEDQIADMRDDEKREAISHIPRTVVPTTGLAWDVSRLGMARFADEETSATIERIGRRHKGTVKDALIASSARDEADAIVTDDKTLRKRIQREGLDVSLLTFEGFRRHVSSL
jgi:predicted nucleic acid-binding protein